MLVFTRLKNESFMIGDDVMITIIDVGSGKVRVGIDAPKDIPVHRKEVYDDLRKAKAKELANELV